MEFARRDLLKGAGLAAGMAAAAGLAGLPGAARADEKKAADGAKAADQKAADAKAAEEEAPDPYTVALDGSEPLAEAADNVAFNTPRGAEDPDWGAQIDHVFGQDSFMDYYLFDGFTGIGVADYNDTARVQDLMMVPAGGTFGSIMLKDGGQGTPESLIRDVRGLVYTTPDGLEVPLKCQSCHGANPRYDGMVVYTTNKPGKLNKSLEVKLASFDSEELPRGINYLLGNPDSGKHNTDGQDNGFSETSLKFWYNEADDCPCGLQHVYTKYAHNGAKPSWLYVKSPNRLDVRFRDLGSGEKGADGYVEGTTLNMSLRDPEAVYEVTVEPSVAGRCWFEVPIDETFFFDPDDPTVVQNSALTNEREYYYKAEVVDGTNTALTGDATVVCDRHTPKVLFFAIQADDAQPGEFELAVSCSANRATGYPTEWSEKPAVIRCRIA